MRWIEADDPQATKLSSLRGTVIGHLAAPGPAGATRDDLDSPHAPFHRTSRPGCAGSPIGSASRFRRLVDAAVAAPDDRLGEHVAAVLVLRPGCAGRRRYPRPAAGERRHHGPNERIGLLTGPGQVLPRRYARPVADRTHRGRSAPVPGSAGRAGAGRADRLDARVLIGRTVAFA
jgi:hypothetical protein